jgi:Tfp pilus assembly protein PilF
MRRYVLPGVCLAAAVLAWVAVWPRLRVGYYCGVARRDLTRGDITSAFEPLARAEQIRPTEPQVQFLLAVAHRRAGQMAAFRARLERAAAKGYLAVYRLHDAWKTLDVWLQWRPESPSARMIRGEFYEGLGDVVAAIEDYRVALAGLPGDCRVRIKLGQVLLRKNHTAEAQEQFRACLAVAPDEVEALLGMAQCARVLGDVAEARRNAMAALAEDLTPHQRALAVAECGRLLLGEQKPRDALVPLAEAAELAPWDPSIRISLATALARSGAALQAEIDAPHQSLAFFYARASTIRRANPERAAPAITSTSNSYKEVVMGLMLGGNESGARGRPTRSGRWGEACQPPQRMDCK